VANRSWTVYLDDDTNTGATHGVVCVARNHSAADLNETSPEFADRIFSLRISAGSCTGRISTVGKAR
jgi:hypothetical protein